mmetsp:Transcript_96499/g.275266  ORF Transcript_96499/g.275266 Transcript_96499/m.275266 type:complete len:478 (-) Transcript_96499:119-1552(-)
MLITATQRLGKALGDLAAAAAGSGGGGGALRRFRARLVMVRWARRYHATAFGSWKALDSERVAAQLIGPYAECFGALLDAQRRGDAAFVQMAGSQLGQLRTALHQLLGESVAAVKIDEVEAAVTQQFSSAMAYVNQTRPTTAAAAAAASPPPPPVPNATRPSGDGGGGEGGGSSGGGSGLKRGFLSGPSKPSAPAAAAPAAAVAADNGAAAEAPSAAAGAGSGRSSGAGGSSAVSLQDLIQNEQLAHDLIMDPQYQLPAADDPPPFTTPGVSAVAGVEAPGSRHTPLSGKEELSGREINHRIQSTMQTMFWRKLVISLTPTAQSKREDFVVGSIVQARFGGPQGSFYEATVTGVHDDGTFAIRYLEDNVVEDRVPLGNFRLATDRVDARPLLGLIDETRKRLEGLTPRRADLIATYREVLDAPLLRQMLMEGVLDGVTILKLFNFVLDTVQQLEAPARADRTIAWRSQFDAYIQVGF